MNETKNWFCSRWDVGIFVSETCVEGEMCRVGVQKLCGWCRRYVLNFIVEMPGSNVGLDTGCFFVVILSSAGNCQDSS